MPSRNAPPLPALHHTAPASTVPVKRRLGKVKKNVFSLDNYFASTQPQGALPRSSNAGTAAAATVVASSASASRHGPCSNTQNDLPHSEVGDQNAMSPAEALLARDGTAGRAADNSKGFAAGAAVPLYASPSHTPYPDGAAGAGAPSHTAGLPNETVLSSAPVVFSSAWRSHLLQCETQLRELVAQGVHAPPSLPRIEQVMDLFDQLTNEVQAHQGNAFLGTLLRLFRVEFCRAIFLEGRSVGSTSNGSDDTSRSVRGAGSGAEREAVAVGSSFATNGETRGSAARRYEDDGLPQTYFEETASLQRAKAALLKTLASGASGETLLLLERQLEDRGEQVTWYESELERVRTQYEQVAEECLTLRRTLEAQQTEAAATQRRLRQEIQSLHVENKDLQIQLFRLRKQISGGMSTQLKDSYRQLKLSKMGLTQRLFNEGDERVALLVFLGQVESRLNEILDSYDNDFVLTHENGRRELQLKMAASATVLLEDMHYCEASYRRLVGAHHVRIVERGRGERGRNSEADGGGRSSGGRTSEPLQRIPVSVVHSGRSEEAPDESDGYVAILFDPKIYEQFQARHAVQARLQQYKKEREEDAKASRAKGTEEPGVFAFPTTDGTFITGGGVSGNNHVVARRETLSTLLSGMFGGDPLAGKAKGEMANSITGAAASATAAATKPGAAGTTTGIAKLPSAPTAAVSREEKLKKWSLDSCTIGGTDNNTNPSSPGYGSPLLSLPGAPSASAGGAQAKQDRTAVTPGFAKRGGGRVSVPATRDGATLTPSPPPLQPPSQRTAPSPPPLLMGDAAPTTPQASLDDVVERQKAEWVAQILGPPTTTVAFTVPGRHPEKGDVVVVHEKAAEVVPAELMMRRVLHHPMEDLCSERFLSTVEVFTGENPAQQRLLCRLNHIDPALPIRVPESTNFVKVKYALADNAVLPGTTTTTTAARSANSTILVSAGGGGGKTTARTSTAAETTRGPGASAMSVASAAFDEPYHAGPPIFRGNPQLRLFKELGNKGLVDANLGLQYCAGAVNSTTAATVAFQRLHPMSPNRAPEWLLYQQLFGPYRSLTPRMMEVTTIDHVMACAAERYFTRMEYRYDECYLRAAGQCANHQLRRDMTERLFKDLHALSDFQEALVDELEARYGFPELVAKTLYEMLCYLNAAGERDTVLAAYLDVIRGFAAPTEIHFMAYMLYHLSYCWPESNMSTPVPIEDVRTVLEYVYRNATSIMPIKPDVILHDYDMATRSAPLNFVNFRQFIATTMAHQEESILLHLHGLFHAYTQRALVDEAGWETYDAVIGKLWHQKDERRSLVRYLTSCLGVNRSSSPTLPQLTLLAASAWSSNLWE